MKKTRKYLLCLLTLALMLFLPASAAQAASGQQPGYVSSITAKVSDNNKVTVTWKKAKNATSYRVYYKQADGKWKTLAKVKGTKYTHTSSRNQGKSKQLPGSAGKLEQGKKRYFLSCVLQGSKLKELAQD